MHQRVILPMPIPSTWHCSKLFDVCHSPRWTRSLGKDSAEAQRAFSTGSSEQTRRVKKGSTVSPLTRLNTVGLQQALWCVPTCPVGAKLARQRFVMEEDSFASHDARPGFWKTVQNLLGFRSDVLLERSCYMHISKVILRPLSYAPAIAMRGRNDHALL